MRRFAAATISLLISAPGVAGASSNVVIGSNVVIAMPAGQAVSVVIRQEAELVSVPVTITSDEKQPAARFADVDRALKALVDRASQGGEITVRQGPVALSGRRGSFNLSGGWSQRPSSAQVHLLMKLEGRDVFDCASQAAKLVAGIEPPGESKYEIGEIQLAIDNPESRRPQLLQAISSDVAKTTRSIGGAAKITLSGLEGPVLVRQVSDREVELFIDYALAIELD